MWRRAGMGVLDVAVTPGGRSVTAEAVKTVWRHTPTVGTTYPMIAATTGSSVIRSKSYSSRSTSKPMWRGLFGSGTNHHAIKLSPDVFKQKRTITTIAKAPRYDELKHDQYGRPSEDDHPYKEAPELSAAKKLTAKRELMPGEIKPGAKADSAAVRRRTTEATRKIYEQNPNYVVDTRLYPKNAGFVGGTEKFSIFDPGDILIRFGEERGTYFCSPGTAFEELGVHASTAGKGLHRYHVLAPIKIIEGVVAPVPELGSPGGATQYKTYQPVFELLRDKVLKDIGFEEEEEEAPTGSDDPSNEL